MPLACQRGEISADWPMHGLRSETRSNRRCGCNALPCTLLARDRLHSCHSYCGCSYRIEQLRDRPLTCASKYSRRVFPRSSEFGRRMSSRNTSIGLYCSAHAEGESCHLYCEQRRQLVISLCVGIRRPSSRKYNIPISSPVLLPDSFIDDNELTSLPDSIFTSLTSLQAL